MNGPTRIERDAFGPIAIPADRYWGAQTERARAVFMIGTERLPVGIIRAFGLQKIAAVRANLHFGKIERRLAEAIEKAAGEVAEGNFDDHFPLAVWQTGSGTQTNMNANEVVANRANEHLGMPLGIRQPVHPNDHVNLSQSSNDSFPTVMNIAGLLAVEGTLLPAMERLRQCLVEKASRYSDTLKIARTHLNDAVPMTLGMQFAGYERQIDRGITRVACSLEDMRQLAQGGTAAGTGLNAPAGFDDRFCEELSALAGTRFAPNPVKTEGMAAHDDLVAMSGALSTVATSLIKISNDIRMLGSGPRCGLAELRIPDDGLTSSIMPGKRNATLAEALIQVCHRVLGNHATITLAGGSGMFELNVAKPVMADALLQSISLLADGIAAFTRGVLEGLEANEEQLQRNVAMSLMLATALTPVLGYDKVADITRYAESNGSTLQEAAIALGHLTAEEYRTHVDPAAMVAQQKFAFDRVRGAARTSPETE